MNDPIKPKAAFYEDRAGRLYCGSCLEVLRTLPLPEQSVSCCVTSPPYWGLRDYLAGCPEGGMVLDPFFGAGTTGLVAYKLGRRWIGIELNPEYCAMARERIEAETRQLKLFA
jgi:DNA modification methylase